VVTLDTNIAVYAFSRGEKAEAAREILASANFVSVQLLNEYVNVAWRKRRLAWPEIQADLAVIRGAVAAVRAIDQNAHHEGIRIAERYQLSFYDSLMLAVALAGGARTIYSEDMQDGLVIDGKLRVVDPFR
jgi:predicted nucleic acid-binding protein